MKVIKDNLFPAPAVFQLIQQSSGADNREMYLVFNMGTRLEIFTDEASAVDLIKISRSMGVNAQIVGRVEPSNVKTLLIKNGSGELIF
jgi:phosphoribosylformylglycinamidine cyclo-ligase